MRICHQILDFAITGSNFPEAFDVLWAIEMTPLFLVRPPLWLCG